MGHVQGPLFFWSYVYYLSKYYEFVDTALLVVKVPFLLMQPCMQCSLQAGFLDKLVDAHRPSP